MKKHRYIILILSILLITTACQIQKFLFDGENKKTIPEYEGTSHFFIFGVGQKHIINPEEICGKGNVSSIESVNSYLNGMASFISYGFYVPRGYRVYCKKGVLSK